MRSGFCAAASAIHWSAFFRDALLSNMTGSACTNAILQLFSMSFMAVDLSFLKISIRRAVRSLYYFVSGGFKRLYRFLVILLFDQKIVRIVSRYCKIGMLWSAKIAAILDSIPINENSKTPWIRSAFQPSSRRMTFGGTSLVRQTRDFSSSVFPIKLYSESKFTKE